MEDKVLQLMEKMYAELTEFRKETNERLTRLEEGQKEIEKKVGSINDKTADLTEFQTDVTAKLDYLIENSKSTNEILGEHEISIRSLRRKPV